MPRRLPYRSTNFYFLFQPKEFSMLLFNQQIAPSAKAHLESQFTFATEMSKQLFSAIQRVNELNLQIAQAALQETLSSTREIFSAQNPYDALSAAANQVSPAAERLRAYHQHLTDIAAKTQVDLAKTAETHVPEASRTASAVADEVARRAAEETQKATQRQREVIEKISTPLQKQDASKSGSANVH
jgi:phasin family protein